MKKFFFVFILLAFGFSMQAQVLELELISDPSFRDVEVSDADTDLSIYIRVKNTSDQTQEYKWEVFFESDACIHTWTYAYCDNNACYDNEFTTNIDPDGTGLNVPTVVMANDSFDFIYHVKPNLYEGCCNMRMDWSLVSDPDNILETVQMQIRVNDPECLTTTDVDDLVLEELEIFPNPVANTLNIRAVDLMVGSTVQLFDLLGKNIVSQQVQESGFNSLDVSSVSTGTYLIRIESEGKSHTSKIFIK